MLINLSNHLSANWSEDQMKEANNLYGEVIDLPFPQVDPEGDEDYIEELSKEYVKKVQIIAAGRPCVIHLMGEMNLLFKLLTRFKKLNIMCVSSTSERISVEHNGVKESVFKFSKFRPYWKDVTAEIKLTEGQQKAFDKMLDFIEETNKSRVFILKGYAGTGKTTLMRFFVRKLQEIGFGYQLLASTGRAAKVLTNSINAGIMASTVHSMIYQYTDLNKDLSKIKKEDLNYDKHGQIYLVFAPRQLEESVDTGKIYIVDEASMIANEKTENVVQAKFGSGQLLTELLNYDKSPKSKFIFIGDPCQLSPVLETRSCALEENYFSSHNILCESVQLTEIMRQAAGNSLIYASKRIRDLREAAPDTKDFYSPNKVCWGKLPFKGCDAICIHNDLEEMISLYLKDIKKYGYNKSIFISKSNNQCSKISNKIRGKLNLSGDVVSVGDLLLVIQNNEPTGLMNGDMVEVIDVRPEKEHHARLVFRLVTVRELFTKREYSMLLLENTLNLQQLNLDPRAQSELFYDFIIRMQEKGITQKKNRNQFDEAMRTDPYLNALRCVYGYAVTCHKAQGGEWDEVYLSMSSAQLSNPIKSDYQWIYTAMTRAKERLHMVNDLYLQ